GPRTIRPTWSAPAASRDGSSWRAAWTPRTSARRSTRRTRGRWTRARAWRRRQASRITTGCERSWRRPDEPERTRQGSDPCTRQLRNIPSTAWLNHAAYRPFWTWQGSDPCHVRKGHGVSYGDYGGRYVPETLIPALDELAVGWTAAQADPGFAAELDRLGREYGGRPTPLTLAERFAPGKRLFLKREDLLHTGAHKLNNALGQVVLAQRLGKTRIIAETGAGQHGVATATVCARFGLECVVYMGAEDMRRQRPNVERMGLLGAEVRPVEFGTKTLKEATSEAIRDWITNVETTHYLIGSCVWPAPYPELVAELQSVIGREAREQILAAEQRLPEAVVACVGGGSNAIGI